MASVRRGPNAEAVVYFEMVLRTLAALTAPFPPAAAATASGVESSGRSSPAGGSIEAGLAVPGSAQPSSTARSYSNEANAAASTRRTTPPGSHAAERRSEEHTSELQSLMRTSYPVFPLKNK